MSIVRIRTVTTEADEYNDPQPATVRRDELYGAFVAPRTSEGVDSNGRSGVIVGLQLYLSHGTDLRYDDRVEVDGEIYEIDGEPGSWQHPHTGWNAGMEAALKRGEG